MRPSFFNEGSVVPGNTQLHKQSQTSAWRECLDSPSRLKEKISLSSLRRPKHTTEQAPPLPQSDELLHHSDYVLDIRRRSKSSAEFCGPSQKLPTSPHTALTTCASPPRLPSCRPAAASSAEGYDVSSRYSLSVDHGISKSSRSGREHNGRPATPVERDRSSISSGHLSRDGGGCSRSDLPVNVDDDELALEPCTESSREASFAFGFDQAGADGTADIVPSIPSQPAPCRQHPDRSKRSEQPYQLSASPKSSLKERSRVQGAVFLKHSKKVVKVLLSTPEPYPHYAEHHRRQAASRVPARATA